MRRAIHIIGLALAVVAVAAVVGCGGSTPTPSGNSGTPASSGTGGASTTVTIKNFAFTPASVTIKVGDSVEFKNEDSVPHTATGQGFDSGTIAPGASYSQKFDTAGTYQYSCTIHPSMAPGTVVVQ